MSPPRPPLRSGPPPGPFRAEFWHSPLRGPWLTAVLGTLLLGGLAVVIVTGFLSHAAYAPDLGRNAIVEPDLPLTIDWPTSPAWLYAATQGFHVVLGIALVPLLLAKLWSVAPHLFAWPPVRSPAHAIERASLALLVGGVLFEFATGIVNAQVYYPFRFNFVVAHYYGAVVTTAALAVHVAVKLPTVRRAFRERGALAPLREDLAHTRPEPQAAGGLARPAPPEPDGVAPAAPTLSRRGLLAFVGGGSLLLLVTSAGQAVGGPLRSVALLSPRGVDGPDGFPVNKTARAAAVTPAMTGSGWRLEVAGGARELRLDRAALLALEQRAETLPIACVEGWSTTQRWSGVPLADLARMAGAAGDRPLRVESLQPRGVLREATLTPDQVADRRSLLALRVNGADLSLDHGFPARVIVPALPGVHCTKWVARMTFL
jgi:DMSO/TMAO reductase YedYZ molybdopterin-dependent catalytic subunit